MSEEDYQRGLRGGDCPVSISDWERWSDWKAGNRVYEREQELDSLAHVRAAPAGSADHRTNLGDHECPHCLQVSLKRGASRCPLCQGEIADAYWSAIRAREQAEDKRVKGATREAEEAKALRRKSAEDAAVAAVRRDTEEWFRGWLAARQKKEAQGFLARMLRPVHLPTTASIGLTEWDSSGRGTWTQQPSLVICGQSYRFDTPHEYIAALRYLTFTQAAGCERAIAGLQRVLNEDWSWPALGDSQRRLKEAADAAASVAEKNVAEAAAAVKTAAAQAAVAAIMPPIEECKRQREVEKSTPASCGWTLSSWNAEKGRWTTQPVLTVCLGTEYRFTTPHEYIAALLQMKTVWKGAEDQDQLNRDISALQDQIIVWERYS